MKYKNIIFVICTIVIIASPSSTFAESQPNMGMNPMTPNMLNEDGSFTSPSSIDETGMPMGAAGGVGDMGGVTSPLPNQTTTAIAAPTVATVAPELLILKKVEEELRGKFKTNIYAPVNIQSLFFTADQLSLLNEARQGFDNSAVAGLGNDTPSSEEETLVASMKQISLGGIVFNNKDNWTIWLNGARTTKATLPKQVLDISVSSDYIELKWFDEETNQIFPIRLRPNQKFDITQKVFLPAG